MRAEYRAARRLQLEALDLRQMLAASGIKLDYALVPAATSVITGDRRADSHGAPVGRRFHRRKVRRKGMHVIGHSSRSGLPNSTSPRKARRLLLSVGDWLLG